MGRKLMVFNLLLLTATVALALGAFYQHDTIHRNIQELIETNPYAFHLRRDLYNCFGPFKIREDEAPYTRLAQIMKYGFPGLDDIRLYSDFVLSYDRRNRVAHWVYEHVRAPCVTSNCNYAIKKKQHHNFKPDLRVPSNFRSDVEDYLKSGYDRGHLAAAGNHKCRQSDCAETFFLTNIAPQVGKGFNQTAWNKLEQYVRDLATLYGSVYVCTGPLYMPTPDKNGKLHVEYEVIGPHTVAVPTHFFKVIIVESKLPQGKPYMEAYLMPNAEIEKRINIRSFLTDINVIERAAGLEFFDGLRRSYFFGTNYSTTSQIYQKFD